MHLVGTGADDHDPGALGWGQCGERGDCPGVNDDSAGAEPVPPAGRGIAADQAVSGGRGTAGDVVGQVVVDEGKYVVRHALHRRWHIDRQPDQNPDRTESVDEKVLIHRSGQKRREVSTPR